MAKRTKPETRVSANPLLRLPVDEQDKILAKGFGGRVAAARVEEELTQESLVKRVNGYGGDIQRSSVSQWETGSHLPPMTTIWRLAHALNRTPEYIAFGVDDTPKEVMPDPETLGFVIAPEVEFGPKETDRTEVRKWGLPTDWLKVELGVTSFTDLVIYKVPVDADGVEYGDRVVVDCSIQGRVPSPPGRFVYWDRYSAVVGQVMVLPGGAKKPMAKVTGASGTSEIEADQLQIIGRVRGLWRKA